MTTREETRLLDPDATFWDVGFHTVHVDDFTLFSLLINMFLSAMRSKKRARLIMHEDAIRAMGVWTQEEAGDAAARLVIGTDGNFMDPKRRNGVLRPFQYLGFVK